MSWTMIHSGIPWLGEIPSHWKAAPFKSVFSLGKGLGITKADLTETGIPVISYGQIHSKLNTGTSINDKLLRFVPEEYLSSSPDALVRKGDIIFADTSEDLEGCGNCIYIDRDSALFAGYHTIIAKNRTKEHNNYFSYLFQTDCWRRQIRSSVNGVKVFSVPQKVLSTTSIIVPPIEEQRRIGLYLDKKCDEINEMILLQEKSIEELKAFKQSVITETVCKGLYPDAPMKDSGVEWIGLIPNHWTTTRLRNLGTTQNGISQGGDYFGEGFPFVSYSDVYKNYSLPTEVKGLAKSNAKEQELFSVRKGDIFFTRTSETIEEIGFSSVCLETIPNAVFAGFLIRFRPKDDTMDNLYAKYYFRSSIHRAYFVKEMNLVIRASLSQDLLKSLPVILPPKEEQKEIGKYLEQCCGEIDTLISVKQSKIEALREFKKSIIYEFITGKEPVL